ncbi:hypothetical protein PCANC_19941 [Puccinia coronata f. sp. avenae]|uniref:CCHC-type domain-containing protein n=1 Tax=Puccinia coronata f. sp. avenae TaxID=200324 RepID=A0A2N5VBT4_9BASI|nr:hypothetical protein PCANC_19941 [Puccinia coronata f. sp. avenae]PLW47467.1 hypothetical protein PCASD_04384 [Puccinia coronata f. sp. avenae]
MYSNPLHKTPTFEQLLIMLDGCKRQVEFSSSSNNNNFNVPSPALFNASSEETSLPPPFHASVDEGNISADVAANAAKSNSCHICRQLGHWAVECPVRKKPPPNRQGQWQPRAPYVQQPSTYNPYCPIFKVLKKLRVQFQSGQ